MFLLLGTGTGLRYSEDRNREPENRQKGEAMKVFLEEYGIAIFTLACIAILVVIATPIGDSIKSAMLTVIKNFVKDPTMYSYGA